MSYAVSQRNREIGIRMALGARQADVLPIFLKQAMMLVAIGAAIGLIAGGLFSRAIGSVLYNVSPTVVRTFLLTTLILAFVAIFAGFFPARRATAVDPVVVLSYE